MSEITTCTLSEYIAKVGSTSEVARRFRACQKQHIHDNSQQTVHQSLY